MSGPEVAEAAQEARVTGLLRRCVLALAAFGVIGAALDLGLSRHWQTAIQLVPWAALGGIAIALALIAVRPTGRALRIARVLLVVVAASAALGIYQHVAANYATAPLDFRFADRWEQMSVPARLWAAGSQAVGPSPTLVPGLLAYLALMTWLATLHHPAFITAHARGLGASAGPVRSDVSAEGGSALTWNKGWS